MAGGKVEGDLLQLALAGTFDVIVHGCNGFHEMGAGIAKPIKQLFPEAYEADKQTSYGGKEKLGTISTAKIERGDVMFHVVNAYTQHHYRGHGRKVSYEAIRSCFEEIAVRFPRSKIGYPFIGAGLGGGDWVKIESIINEALEGIDHTLVVLQY